MFEEFFASRWAFIGSMVGTGGAILLLVSSVIALVIAYRDYKSKNAVIT